MTNKIEQFGKKLAEKIGPEKIFAAEGQIIAKPASVTEVVEVIKTAREEDVPFAPGRYTVGPAHPPAAEPELIISLENMGNIHQADLPESCLLAEPAALRRAVAETAAARGFYFPGEKCPHQLPTVGESAAACYLNGDPHFLCSDTCLCGLELVSFDGEIVTAGGPCVVELDSYSLTYVLGGQSKGPAVITGIYLKLFPAQEV
ncbi:MAG: FAD-binding protein [Bacillota bacterium]